MSEINKIRYHGVDYDIGGTGNEIFIGKVEKAPQEAKIIVDGFIATPDTPEKNYEEIYSEEERVIGTWFGKPLYRKVLNINNVAVGSSSIDISNLTVNKMIKINYSQIKIDTVDINNYYVSTGDYCRIFYRNNKLEFRIGGGFSSCNFEIILEYTKITD